MESFTRLNIVNGEDHIAPVMYSSGGNVDSAREWITGRSSAPKQADVAILSNLRVFVMVYASLIRGYSHALRHESPSCGKRIAK